MLKIFVFFWKGFFFHIYAIQSNSDDIIGEWV